MMSKTLRTLSTVILFLTGSVAIAGGGMEGGGGGLAEQRILYAYANLEKFLSMCMATSHCNLSPNDRDLVNSIRSSLPAERGISDLIEFVMPKNDAEFFIDGRVAAAKTGFKVGDKILVNLKMIYRQELQGTVPLSLPDAIGLVVHELGHHQGVKDDTRLDLIATKISSIAAGRTQYVDREFNFGHELRLTVINDYNSQLPVAVLLNDDEKIVDLTPIFGVFADCKKRYSEWPAEQPPGGLDLQYSVVLNPNWTLEYRGSPAQMGSTRTLQFRGMIQWQCGKKDWGTIAADRFFTVDLQFSQNYDGTLRHYIDGSALIHEL